MAEVLSLVYQQFRRCLVADMVITMINQGNGDSNMKNGCLLLEAWLHYLGYRSVSCLALCLSAKGRLAWLAAVV